MIRQEFSRIDAKRRQQIDHKKKQFKEPQYQQQDYRSRLNFYSIPPTADITLEEFEEWAIHRLKVLAELEACNFRNKSPEETTAYMNPLLATHLPLSQNSAKSAAQQDERKRDHYSHFILRLAFSSTADLRHRFARLETQLFRLRYLQNDARDRNEFVTALAFDWERVDEDEKRILATGLNAIYPAYLRKNLPPSEQEDANNWFKVDWERVPELVESRRVLLRAGKAYVAAREQTSMVVGEFARRLDTALEQTAKALPRLDEDDRLSPILAHLSRNFTAPGAEYSADSALSTELGAPISAASIDPLSEHFPLCMRNLHLQLRKNSHLKHFSRLQYTLFLKGLGLSLEEALVFWRQSFKLVTDDTFNKEYRYNVRHSYGDVGGDSNRRGRGYTPYSCQKLLTEPLPGAGQNHGCPYRTYGEDNLVSLLEGVGVREREVLKGVREDVRRQRYHIACNRVFEWSHAGQLKRVKEEGTWKSEDLDTIVHPNVYFKRSFLLGQLAKGGGGGDGTPRREVQMQD